MLAAGMTLAAAAFAAREPVLGQIDLPHPYYYREMFLPQLTSGPSSLAWLPDSRSLIYSMAGSLWRQDVASGIARQLTAGSSYDYQPDCSPDGRWVVFTTYRGSALELAVLDLASGTTRALTSNGAVNVEPRFSPDGRRIVFTSTQFKRRFHVFVAPFDAGVLGAPVRLTGESRSDLPRYYYSAYDHEINPTWAPDGREILFVSNRGHIYGTGGLWRTSAQADAASLAAGAPLAPTAREIHYEETNWKPRPEFAPDGSRLVFSSYTGRQWHNLWVLPSNGGDAFPITYGDWDQTNPRWSPDGARIAFISNRTGTTQIEVMGFPGADPRPLAATERHYLQAMGRVQITLHDAAGKPASARIGVTDAAGRSYAPDAAWVHADDGIERARAPFEAHYFHARGSVSIEVPAGPVRIDILRGFTRRFERRELTIPSQGDAALDVNVDDGRFTVPAAGHWVSSDVHVHMNYGGVYRNTPAHLAAQAEAEGLDIVNALIVNKEQRFPDIVHSGAGLDPDSLPDALVVHGQEFHTSYWGHLGLLDIHDTILLPGYAGYPGTAAASLYPMNADVADLAHARGALVGYVHPFDDPPEPLAVPHQTLTNELPVDVALGKVDYMEILGFSDHRATADVWYRLLDLGFRIPAAGGTDAMANFASLRGPVGMNRVFARIPDGATTPAGFLEALKGGRTFATNGPLLGLTLGTAELGDTLQFASAPRSLPYVARLDSIVTVDHLDLVCNGRVAAALVKGKPIDHGEFRGTLAPRTSGWCVLRASSDAARYPVLDNYVYASTSPIYVQIAGRRANSPEDARYFAAWIDRITESTAAYPDWNTAAEKAGVLERLQRAKLVFTSLE
jgi:Tol biopolymer transport system component